MHLYHGISVEMLHGNGADTNQIIASILSRVFENSITFCASRAQMYVYDHARGFWKESVGENQSVEDGIRELAAYLDNEFHDRLGEETILSPHQKSHIATGAWSLRQSLLRGQYSVPSVCLALRALVSH